MSAKEFVKWSRKSDLALEVRSLAHKCGEHEKVKRADNKYRAIIDYIGAGINWGG